MEEHRGSLPPHSGDEDAFNRLLSLLDKDFSVENLDTEAARLTVDRNGAALEIELGPGTPGSNIWRQIGIDWEPTSR